MKYLLFSFVFQMRMTLLVVRLLRRLQLSHILITALLLPAIYLAHAYNVWEYARTTPFAYFKYPLEVDLNSIVDSVLQGDQVQTRPINPSNYPYILNPDRKCKNEDGDDEDVFMLFVIKSKLDDFDQRNMIRRTWAHEYLIPSARIRRVFLLGAKPSDKTLQHRIGLESQEYDDIVQQYFVDHYYNNTIKLQMGFHWASSYCRSAQYIAFLDDDYYVSTANLVKLFKNIPEQKTVNTIFGYIWQTSMPMRMKSSKWYISLEEYPYRLWPPYPTAGSFFMSFDTAQRISIAMQYVKYLRFDDVFVGIVCHKLGLKLQHLKQVYFYALPYDKRKYKDVIAVHGYKDVELLSEVFKEQEEYRKLLKKLS